MGSPVSITIKVGERDLIIETNKLAKQANGALTARMGDTIVLATAVAADAPREDSDFFPLTCDYREMTSAAGKFPGGYIKREGRPTEKEILTSRLIDRPIRPLFPEGYFNEVQIIATVFSADDVNEPDVIAMTAASAALAISDIPFTGPVGAVRVGKIDDDYIINPTHEQMEKCSIDLVIAGTENAVLMVEGHAKFISEEEMITAVKTGHDAIKNIVAGIKQLVSQCGKEKSKPELIVVPEELINKVNEIVAPSLLEKLTIKEKKARNEALSDLHAQVTSAIVGEKPEESPYSQMQIDMAYKDATKKILRKLLVEEGKRVDGRKVDEIRPISIEVGAMPRAHGSAIFTRGETQALALATLGSESDEQKLDSLVGEKVKRFMVHYNFPPFSTGETKPLRSPGRREIGHGMLAERALTAVIPSEEEFPYTIRITSDILESNGSSSMATVCAGSLALMDAGVPVKSAIAGIAMGLVMENDKTIVISDILGMEDALGDMDFKVAGSSEGITAFQMDIKVEGITFEIMKEALERARAGRMHILDKMNEALAQPRPTISPYAPRIEVVYIEPDKIGTLIGPGGKTIRKITEETKVEINIDDDGKVSMYSNNMEMMQKAKKMVEDITAEVEVGKIYRGVVKNIMDFGAFVEILPGQQGLVHISELADYRVNKVEDIVQIGDEVMVKVVEIDNKGRINLSRKEAIFGEGGGEREHDAPPPRPRHDDRRDDRRGNRFDGPRRDSRDSGGFDRRGRSDDRRGRNDDRRGGGGDRFRR